MRLNRAAQHALVQMPLDMRAPGPGVVIAQLQIEITRVCQKITAQQILFIVGAAGPGLQIIERQKDIVKNKVIISKPAILSRKRNFVDQRYIATLNDFLFF